MGRLQDLTEKPDWMLIENDGVLYRGPSRGNPIDFYNPVEQVWMPIANPSAPRGIEWGYEVTVQDAMNLIET